MAVKPTTRTMDDIATEEERRRIQRGKNQSAIDLLESWADATDEEVAEQRETWEFLKNAVDEDRLSDRKLFP
jgi:hypothetical protein